MTSAPPRAAPAETLRGVLISTSLIQMVSTATALALTALAPRAAAVFGMPGYYVGYQISVIYLSGAVASAMAGTLVHRHGAVRIEQAALLTFALALAALAFAQVALAVVASLLIGIGYGLQNPASSQILQRVTPPDRRNIVFSIKQAGVPLGAAVASLCIPFIEHHAGWRTAFLLMAIVPLILFAHIGRHVEPAATRASATTGFLDRFAQEQRLIWRRAETRTLTLLGLLYSAVQLSFSGFVVLMLVDDAHWSLVAAGAVAGLAQVCGAGARIFWGAMADLTRSSFLMLAIIGFGTGAAMLALPAIGALPAPAQIALLCLISTGATGWNGVLMASLSRYSAPGDAGRVVGGSLVYTFIGVMIGPSSFALIFGADGRYGTTFAIFAGVMILGGVLAGRIALRHRQLPR